MRVWDDLDLTFWEWVKLIVGSALSFVVLYILLAGSLLMWGE